MTPAPRRNLELKAPCPDLAAARTPPSRAGGAVPLSLSPPAACCLGHAAPIPTRPARAKGARVQTASPDVPPCLGGWSAGAPRGAP